MYFSDFAKLGSGSEMLVMANLFKFVTPANQLKHLNKIDYCNPASSGESNSSSDVASAFASCKDVVGNSHNSQDVACSLGAEEVRHDASISSRTRVTKRFRVKAIEALVIDVIMMLLLDAVDFLRSTLSYFFALSFHFLRNLIYLGICFMKITKCDPPSEDLDAQAVAPFKFK